MLDTYRDFVLEAPAGVAVITGPTGSGKTSTLYSSIDAVNHIGVKIITAEDPVEYEIEGIMQCSLNPKAGLTFDDTLKAIVRQDPDIIVLGEIRDRTSAATAIQAALTGHKVFTTFHTEDAVGGLLRLMNMDIETFLISSTVICMVAQRLVRKICPDCRTETTPSLRTLGLLGVDPADVKGFEFHVGRGCQECSYTGYRGRTAIYELLVLDEQVKEAILQQQTSYYIRRISIEDSGLVSLRESGIAKVVQGLTTFEEVLSQAPGSLTPRPVRDILVRIGEEI
jgi:type IV pilus assembly protein PilB